MARALAPADQPKPAPEEPESAGADEPGPAQGKGYDWSAGEAELADVVPPRFVEPESEQD